MGQVDRGLVGGDIDHDTHSLNIQYYWAAKVSSAYLPERTSDDYLVVGVRDEKADKDENTAAIRQEGRPRVRRDQGQDTTGQHDDVHQVADHTTSTYSMCHWGPKGRSIVLVLLI